MLKRFALVGVLIALVGCGRADDTVAESPISGTITASTGLTAFTFHGNTAYYANFGATGLVLSAATSASTAGDIASYAWEQISGPTATVTSADLTSATLEFTAPAITAMLHAAEQYRWQVLPISRDDAVLVFRLTVTDSAGNTDVGTYSVYLFDNGTQIQNSAGLQNVGIGEKVYLSGPSLGGSTGAIAVTDWSWTLTAPSGSAAVFGDTGTTTSALQIVSFTPDVAGTYTIAYSSTTAKTNTKTGSDETAQPAGTLTINASSYVGVGTVNGSSADSSIGQCGSCHYENEETWDDTGHSVQFEQAIGSYASKAPAPYCWECHTVGYNTAATGNDGFSDLVTETAYQFPSAGTTWANFVTDNPTLTPLTNIQCENCHGPGASHLGTITDSKIYYSNWSPGVCGKCHSQEAEWKISAHNETGVKSGSARYQTSWSGVSCARCHTSGGFIEHIAGDEVTAQSNAAIGGTEFLGVGCPACHDPHSQGADAVDGSTAISGNDSTQLRVLGNVTMKDDAATVVNAGKAAVCYECHDGNYTHGEEDCDSNADGTVDAVCATLDQAATQYQRQIHGNPQAFVLEGLGALTSFSDTTYNFELTENSFHTSSRFTLANGAGDSTLSTENNKCVTCHMGTAPEAEEEGYRLVGGHTFKVANGDTEFLTTCTVCHTGLATFNRAARADYDGDGSTEGIQDEISGLLLALSTKILSLDSTNVTGGTTSADGVITVGNLSISTLAKLNAMQIDVRRAVWNHNLISKDGSLGVHNAAFAIQVLQKTYSAVSQINGGNSFATDYPDATLR